MIRALRFLFTLFTWVAIGAFSLLALYTVGSNVSAFGGYQSFLVQSGSMEPTIRIGDVVLVHAQSRYAPADIITFRESSQGRVVTHRVASMQEAKGESARFVTKGDANRDEDEDEVSIQDIIGKVVFTIPKLGLLIAFVRTPLGLIVFILLPTLGIVFDEIIKLTRNPRHA